MRLMNSSSEQAMTLAECSRKISPNRPPRKLPPSLPPTSAVPSPVLANYFKAMLPMVPHLLAEALARRLPHPIQLLPLP